MDFAKTTSTKGKPLIIYKSQKYREVRKNEIKGDVVWRCTVKQCNVKLKTNTAVSEILSVTGDHVHQNMSEEALTRYVYNASIKQACLEANFPPPDAPKDAVGANETAWPAQAPSPGPSRKADNGPRPSTSGFVKNDPGTPPPMVMNPYVEQQQAPRLLPKPIQPRPAQQQQPQQPHMRLRVRPPPPPPPEDVDMEPEPQQVCLRWNSFHSNMQTMFPNLLNREKFVDVTLACEGRSIKCHKVVLSSCSTYLERLLSENPCKHPIILMPRDLRYWELRALVDFMYRGEVNVEHEQLSSLLAAAESLQIKGLAGPSSSLPDQQEEEEEERAPSPRVKRKRVASPPPPPVIHRPPPLPQRPRNRPVSPPSAADTPRLPNSSAVSITRLATRPPPTPVVVVTPRLPVMERQSPGIEITPVVSFEEIKVEPVDISSNDEDLDQTQDYEMEKDYEETEDVDEGGGSEADDGRGGDDGDPSTSDRGNGILETAVQNAGFSGNNGLEYSTDEQHPPDNATEYIEIPIATEPGGTEETT